MKYIPCGYIDVASFKNDLHATIQPQVPEDTAMLVTIDHLYSDLLRIDGKCINTKVSLSYQDNTVIQICGSHHDLRFEWYYSEIEVSVEFVILYVPYYLIMSYGLYHTEKPKKSIMRADYNNCL